MDCEYPGASVVRGAKKGNMRNTIYLRWRSVRREAVGLSLVPVLTCVILALASLSAPCLPPKLSIRAAGEVRQNEIKVGESGEVRSGEVRSGEVRIGEVKRDWFDPCLGSHWELVTNPAHPEWPGRLFLVDANGRLLQPAESRVITGGLPALDRLNRPSSSTQFSPSAPANPASSPAQFSEALPIAIRAGDRVTLEQDTPILRARFQAIALQSAAVGQRMRVRLGAGTHSGHGLDGGVVAALVTGPGEAKWLGAEGVEP